MEPKHSGYNEQKMQNFYDDTMRQLRNEFHIHSTTLEHVNLTPDEQGKQTEANGLANISANGSGDGSGYKCSIHHR